jgi:hypothetical protein
MLYGKVTRIDVWGIPRADLEVGTPEFSDVALVGYCSYKVGDNIFVMQFTPKLWWVPAHSTSHQKTSREVTIPGNPRDMMRYCVWWPLVPQQAQ